MFDPDLMKKIRRRAHEIWESEGRPEGRARIHWRRAEAEFRDELGICHSSERPLRPHARLAEKPGTVSQHQ
jgi:hypothetical protein